MELQGVIKQINPTEERGEKKFKTRTIILDRTSTYQGVTRENYTEIQLLGENTNVPENLQLKPGDFIKFNFDISGRFYTDKEGNQRLGQSVSAWNINVITIANS